MCQPESQQNKWTEINRIAINYLLQNSTELFQMHEPYAQFVTNLIQLCKLYVPCFLLTVSLVYLCVYKGNKRHTQLHKWTNWERWKERDSANFLQPSYHSIVIEVEKVHKTSAKLTSPTITINLKVPILTTRSQSTFLKKDCLLRTFCLCIAQLCK